MTDRADFFARLRAVLGRTSGLFAAAVAERPAAPGRLLETLERELAEGWPETLRRFRQEFERVGGVFHRAGSIDEVPAVVAAIARQHDARRVVTWHPAALGADLAPGLRAQGLETTVMPPGELRGAEERARLRETVAAAELGLTGVDLAVAETGSLVLRSGPGRPRSTSLLPPYHVAVLGAGALVESLAQVGLFLEAWHERDGLAGPGAMINIITGPSRTADIELTLTRGVHGPREVHAVFVDTPDRG